MRESERAEWKKKVVELRTENEKLRSVCFSNCQRIDNMKNVIKQYVHSDNWGVQWSLDTRGAEWTEQKNERRCDLVNKEIDGTLTPEEVVELEKLQKEMLAYRRKLAPLPIETAREVHNELLKQAAENKR